MVVAQQLLVALKQRKILEMNVRHLYVWFFALLFVSCEYDTDLCLQLDFDEHATVKQSEFDSIITREEVIWGILRDSNAITGEYYYCFVPDSVILSFDHGFQRDTLILKNNGKIVLEEILLTDNRTSYATSIALSKEELGDIIISLNGHAATTRFNSDYSYIEFNVVDGCLNLYHTNKYSERF
jgi:hypothetical protein